MSLRSYFKSGLLTATLAVSTSVLASPSFANPADLFFFNDSFTHLATDQDVYPANYPYPYPAVQTLVLDMTSSGFIAPPYIQFEYPDVVAERQFTGFRSVMREMYDLQTLSDPNIRTRDLPSPYTTALSEFCSYYNVTGAAYPVTGTPNAAECNAPVPVAAAPEPVAPQPVFIPRAAPVPALW